MKELCIVLMMLIFSARSASATTMHRQKFKCSVCGSENEYSVLTSTNAFGAPDLDLRPPEMQRSTMPMWVQECRQCGYSASEISDPCKVSPDFLKSESYIRCEGIKFESKLAAAFYKEYMIERECGEIIDAFYSVLHAAWSCDDKKDKESAKICREKAASLASELTSSGKLNDSRRENIMLMRADILRRAGHFEEVISEYSSVTFKGDKRNNPDIMNAILKFQIERAHAKDSKCYTIQDAVKEQ